MQRLHKTTQIHIATADCSIDNVSKNDPMSSRQLQVYQKPAECTLTIFHIVNIGNICSWCNWHIFIDIVRYFLVL